MVPSIAHEKHPSLPVWRYQVSARRWIRTIWYSRHHFTFPERRQRMLIVCPRPKAGLVHFLVYRSRATLRVGHLPVKRAMPADSRSRSGVEDGRAD
jgi:hypothetical protein